jgi:hypothetical protein
MPSSSALPQDAAHFLGAPLFAPVFQPIRALPASLACSVLARPSKNIPTTQETIDQAARAADRNPADIQRLYNISGTIGDQDGASGLVGSINDWIALLTQWATELGMDTFIFWPAEPTTEQVELFATEIAPGVRDAVAERRG